MREFLEVEGEGDEDIPSDGHGNPNDRAFVEFWELDLGPISYGAVHGGDLERKWVVVGTHVNVQTVSR
jgi:hypothetical protein